MGMQLQEMQQQMAQMQEENQKLQEAADANQTKLQTEQLSIESKERISSSETSAKTVSAESMKSAEIAANTELEKERIASHERIEMAKARSTMGQQPQIPGETQGLAEPDSQQLAMAEFNKLISEFMRVMSADRVAVRDQSGRLVRTRIDVQQNQ